MPEFERHESIETDSFQDIKDAIDLAFYGEEIEACAPELLPLHSVNGDEWFNTRKRAKSSYDPTAASLVRVTHLLYEIRGNNGAEVTKNILYLKWEDEEKTSLYFSLDVLKLASFRLDENNENRLVYFGEDAVKDQRVKAKMGLAAITSFMD